MTSARDVIDEALALWDEADDIGKAERSAFIEHALLDAGLCIVPMEATPTMARAAIESDDMRTGVEAFRHAYRAMIAAYREEG